MLVQPGIFFYSGSISDDYGSQLGTFSGTYELTTPIDGSTFTQLVENSAKSRFYEKARERGVRVPLKCKVNLQALNKL